MCMKVALPDATSKRSPIKQSEFSKKRIQVKYLVLKDHMPSASLVQELRVETAIQFKNQQ